MVGEACQQGPEGADHTMSVVMRRAGLLFVPPSSCMASLTPSEAGTELSACPLQGRTCTQGELRSLNARLPKEDFGVEGNPLDSSPLLPGILGQEPAACQVTLLLAVLPRGD